jgi:hypothetical protein
VIAVSIPQSPTETALATSAPTAAVLGEAKQSVATSKSKPAAKPIVQTPEPIAVLGTNIDTKAPAAAINARPDYAPLWAHVATSPRSMLEYAYWVLALLVILALGVATSFELHIHHIRKATSAGILLAFIFVMFLAANTFVFTSPTITPQATMAAAAGAAL